MEGLRDLLPRTGTVLPSFTRVYGVILELGPHLVDWIRLGTVFSDDEREQLLDVPVESWGQICVKVDVEQQSVRVPRLPEGAELAHPQLVDIRGI